MLPGESPVRSTEELAVWLRWRQERHPGSRICASRGSAGFFGTGAIPLAGSSRYPRGGVTGK